MRRVCRVLVHRSIHSLKGGSIENLEYLCGKTKVFQQYVFMSYCKVINLVNSYLHIYVVYRWFSSNDLISVEIIVFLHIPIKPMILWLQFNCSILQKYSGNIWLHITIRNSVN